MTSLFKPEFFTRNRAKLRGLFPDGPIVITANGLLQRSGDTTFPFRQDSSFWYLTGINDPDTILVIDEDTEFLIVAYRADNRINFDGDIDKVGLSQVSGVGVVLDQNEGWAKLKTCIRKAKTVMTPDALPAYFATGGFYVNPARANLVSQLKEINPEIELTDIRSELAKLRMTKQPQELKAIRAAIEITVDAFNSLPENFGFKTEYELEAHITKQFRAKGAVHAYQPIVAGGINACTLHYISNADRISAGQLLLIDAGAEVENYAADITRTYALGTPSKRQQQVSEAVQDVQKFALKILKPGTSLRDYEQKVEQLMGEKLLELGLIKTAEQRNIRRYYPHSTSHFLGLDVHDVGNYEQPLAAGMVLTVEPGIYIPEEEIGVRIEDDVLITKNGVEVLSKKLPPTLLQLS